ncbi:MAG TPA: spore coat U domain-containing protein [Kofleriaceae bacterium]
MKQLVVAALLCGLGAAADAGTTTGTMTVTASVASSCSVTAGTLAFGAYNTVTGTAVNGSTTLSLSCTKGSTATITLGQGSQPATGSTDIIPLRQMANGTSRLGYSIFQDPTRLIIWGNTAITGVTYLSLTAAATNVNVYGTITASQDVPGGSYTDSVLATVSF